MIIEIFIGLIIIGIIIYLLSQDRTEYKFKRADKLIQEKKYSIAQSILKKILNRHKEAATKYAECFYLQGIDLKKNSKDKAVQFFEKVIKSRTLLTPKSNTESFDRMEAYASYEIASLYFTRLDDIDPALSVNALKENLRFIKKAKKTGREKDFLLLQNNHFVKLAEIHFTIANQNELENDIINAKSNYFRVYSYLNNITHNSLYQSAIIREKICQIKLGDTIDDSVLEEVRHYSNIHKNELLFRYAHSLINKKKNYVTALNILQKEFDSSSPIVSKLIHYCINEKIKKDTSTVESINNLIIKLHKNELTENEVDGFYKLIFSGTNGIRELPPDVISQIEEVKPSLFNRILINSFNNKNFGKAINTILHYKDFYEFPTLLKNLGNACINFLASGKVSDKNYKSIISSFLTSVYSDKVMINSLSNTFWDDGYTFTLIDSIGSNFRNHSGLPPNINYNEADATNISIESAQKELIKQFELLLSKKVDGLNSTDQIQHFYNKEKNSIELAIKFIHKELLIPTPYFAKRYNLSDTVIEEIENAYELTYKDEILEAGLPYLPSDNSYWLSDYSHALNVKNEIINAINNEDVEFLKTIPENQIDLLRSFDNISQSLEDEIHNKFYNLIEIKPYSETLISLMKSAIILSPSTDKLNYQYATYISSYCINKVNANEITHYKALTLMIDAYLAQKNNVRICKNLITLIRFNLLNILNDYVRNPHEICKLCDKIKNNRSTTFNQNINELINIKEEIINSLSPTDRLSLMTDKNLSTNGKKLKMIIDYINKLTD